MPHLVRIPTLAALLGLLASAPLAAQRGVVHGTVRDTAGAPIPEASVVIMPDHRARADSAGRFVLTNVKPGLHEIRVRRVGFGPYDATLRFKADGSDTVRAELPASARKLPTVVTRAERQCHRYKYDGVWCRKADGRGIVLTVDEIDEAQPEFLADLIEGTRGIRVDFGASAYGQTRFPRPVGRCMVTLLNGLPPLPGNSWTPWARGATDDVAGLEVYRPNETPPEYRFEARRGEPCWLVNVWTWEKLKAS
jgi:hypothetical protein